MFVFSMPSLRPVFSIFCASCNEILSSGHLKPIYRVEWISHILLYVRMCTYHRSRLYATLATAMSLGFLRTMYLFRDMISFPSQVVCRIAKLNDYPLAMVVNIFLNDPFDCII